MLYTKGLTYYDNNDWFYETLTEILENKLQGAIFAFGEKEQKIKNILGQELQDIKVPKGMGGLEKQKRFFAIINKLQKDAEGAGYKIEVKYPSFDLSYNPSENNTVLDVSKVELKVAKLVYVD